MNRKEQERKMMEILRVLAEEGHPLVIKRIEGKLRIRFHGLTVKQVKDILDTGLCKSPAIMVKHRGN